MAGMHEWLESVEHIRLEIDEVLDAPTSRVAMAERARSFNDQLTDHQVDELLDELERFVRGTPDLLELAGIEAETNGALEQMQPLLNEAAMYFVEPDDLIPDHLGLYGLLDDAYLVQRFLLTASEHHQAEHGTPLLGEGLRPAVGVVRQWIGDEAADQLDAKVDTDVAKFPWAGVLVGAALGLGALWLVGKALSGGGDPTGGVGSWGNSHEAEMARLGASMGVSLSY